MRCTLAKKILPLYISDDLPDEQMVSLRKHLEACAPCRQLAAEYSENQLWLRTLGAPQFPDAVFDDLRNDVQKEIAQANPQSVWFEWLIPRWNSTTAAATAAAAAVLIAAVGIYIWRSQPDSKSPPVVRSNDWKRMNDNPGAVNGKEQPSTMMKDIVSGRDKPLGPSVNRRPLRSKSPRPPNPYGLHRTTVWHEQTYVATTDTENIQEMLRIELQTADPNIRIIWLTPKYSNSPSDTVNTNR